MGSLACHTALLVYCSMNRHVYRPTILQEYMAPEVLNCPFKNRPDENKDNAALHYSYHVDTVRCSTAP